MIKMLILNEFSHRAALILLTVLLCYSPVAAIWEGRKDNKTVAELELMNDSELLREMMRVCAAITHLAPLYGPKIQLDGIEYAETIERVSRKQHGGKSPRWMEDLLVATAQGNFRECEQVFNRYLQEKKRDNQRQKKGQ